MSFSFRKYLKKKFVIPAVIVFLIVGGVVYSKTRTKVPEFSSTVVAKADLFQSVEETGTVEAGTNLSYGWETSGRVATIRKHVGDVVAQGEVVATLENRQESARLSGAISQLASAQAVLDKQLAGPSDEEKAKGAASVEKARTAVTAAQRTLDQAKATQLNDESKYSQAVTDAYENGATDVNDAVSTAVNTLATIADIQQKYNTFETKYPYNSDIEAAMGTAIQLMTGTQTTGDISGEAVLSYTGGLRADARALTSATPHATILSVAKRAVDAIKAVRRAGDIASDGLYVTLEATTADKTLLSTARTNVDAALASATAAAQGMQNADITYDNTKRTDAIAVDRSAQDVLSAQAALRETEAAYNDLIAPSREVDVASLRANVAQQQANVASSQQDFEKTVLKALANGVVSKLDVDIGETANANQNVLSIVSKDLDIKVDISETDISKVTVGDNAEITLDAFGTDKKFNGQVLAIEPAQTEVSGVVYYKTTVALALDPQNIEGVRPGMTANVRIITASKPAVLIVPRRAILSEGDRQYVRVLTNKAKGQFVSRDVVTGLSGENGMVEVVSGLKEGEEIVTFLKEN